MFTAYRASNAKHTKSGFETYEDAKKYIERFLCQGCLDDYKRGYEQDELDGEKYPIESVMSTPCGAEWFIITDEEYENSEDLTDIFIASGMVPDNDNTWNKLTIDQKCRISNKQAKLENENK